MNMKHFTKRSLFYGKKREYLIAVNSFWPLLNLQCPLLLHREPLLSRKDAGLRIRCHFRVVQLSHHMSKLCEWSEKMLSYWMILQTHVHFIICHNIYLNVKQCLQKFSFNLPGLPHRPDCVPAHLPPGGLQPSPGQVKGRRKQDLAGVHQGSTRAAWRLAGQEDKVPGTRSDFVLVGEA